MFIEMNVAHMEVWMETLKDTLDENNHLVIDKDVVSDIIFF